MKKTDLTALDDISYIFMGVDPKNKISVFLHNFKNTIKYMIPYQIREYYRKNIETLWKPQHSRIRKAIPKYWYDLDYVLIQVNFEIIKSFYEDEYKDGIVDWDANQDHKNFANWLVSAYTYITETRPKLEQELSAAYPEENIFSENKQKKMSYKELYHDVDRIEKHIHKMDTKILTELIKYRDYLWT